jgi:small subunit ribosomal protein S16
VAVKIKLKRIGKIHAPQYRIVVADARTKRDGRAIEEIGKYHPKEEPSLIEVKSERALYWLGVGAQPTAAVTVLLKITGDWQKFKGLPGTEGTLRVAPARADRAAVFAVAAAEAAAITSTPKPKAKKVEAAPAAAAPAAAAPVEAAPVEAAPVEAAPVEAAPVEAAPVEAAPVEAAPVEAPTAEAPVAPAVAEAPAEEAAPATDVEA